MRGVDVRYKSECWLKMSHQLDLRVAENAICVVKDICVPSANMARADIGAYDGIMDSDTHYFESMVLRAKKIVSKNRDDLNDGVFY